MKSLLALLALFVALEGSAAPFLEADVVAGVAQCGVFMDAAPKVLVPAAALKCRYDLAGLAAGPHSVTMTALSVADPIWGTQESGPSSPLAFSRPGAPASPSGLVLKP